MRRASQILVGAVLLVALTACGGGEASQAGGESTALPTDASSGDSGRSSDPQSGQLIEQENPRRFIERWAAAEARMQHGGPAKPYLALSRGCSACVSLARTVARYYAAGGYVRGGTWRIDSVTSGGSANGYPLYTVHAQAAPMTVRESSTSPEQHVPGRAVTYDLGLLARGSSFTVASRTLRS